MKLSATLTRDHGVSRLEDPLFSWSVETGRADCGACGVAGSMAGAMVAVEEALAETRGVEGEVHSCRLSPVSSVYLYGSMVAHAVRHEVTGAVSWWGDLP